MLSRLPRHARIVGLVWLVTSAIAVPLIVWVLGPHLPPGAMTSEASEQTSANIVLTAICAPVVLLIVVYFVYAFVVFRARGGAIEDGAPIRGHAPTQTLWLLITSATVLALAIWGSLVLVVSAHGAGGGQGPDPIDPPAGAKQALQVQVIGQQWNWTYRFPQTGALETDSLNLPADTLVEFHVTSLDVTHSFWAYELGVKADAVPGVDNIAFVHTRRTGSFSIRCAELCGLWHGHMFQTGHVVSLTDFKSWIAGEEKAQSLNQKYLPSYARHYFPDPQRRAG
ncbi:MAG TPA: cytochrome c oxidase subunit II [Gaiellaceae bacterium]|nr:cytochrome c oxidase subunit II [Gaiellaceae bacterium]